MSRQQADDTVTTAALTVGSLVFYYDEGWRTGHLEEIKGKTARIRPIVSKYAAIPRCVRVPAEDVKEIKEKH